MGKENQKHNDNIPCEMVQDLLPLYSDGVVSEVTEKAIENHLEDCEDCRNELSLIREELPEKECSGDTKSRFQNWKSKLRKKQIMSLTVIAIVTCVVVVFASYMLFQKPIVNVAAEDIHVVKFYVIDNDEGEKSVVCVFEIAKDALNGPQPNAFLLEKDGDNAVVQFDMKKPVITKKDEPVICYSGTSMDFNAKEILFNGKVIWSQEENENNPIPDYISAYEKSHRRLWKRKDAQ